MPTPTALPDDFRKRLGQRVELAMTTLGRAQSRLVELGIGAVEDHAIGKAFRRR